MKRLIVMIAFASTVLLTSCGEDDSDMKSTSNAKYFVGIEAATDPATDVLAIAASITEGEISPVGNGFEQTAWMTFLQGKDQIFVSGYTSAPELTSYELFDGELVKGESLFLDQTPYAYDIVDESNMVIISSPRSGFSEKKIYHIDTDNMSIINSVESNFGNLEADSLLAFPTDMKVRGDKLFISYYHIHGGGSFSTPSSNVARVAIFSYPNLEFEKLISDDRAANIGRYYGHNALEIDENGDIYTFSSSSLACGYAPVPENNSAILRIRNGETEFDQDYYVDFETLSGGFKINDLLYAANGKAVVRVVKEDETDAAYLWASYAPTSENPILETAVIDLYNESFTLMDMPNGGGGWNTAHLVDGGTVYLGVSNSSFAGIYVIDTQSEVAIEGASIDGNYAKGILTLQ